MRVGYIHSIIVIEKATVTFYIAYMQCKRIGLIYYVIWELYNNSPIDF